MITEENISTYIDKITSQDRLALAQAISLVESTKKEHKIVAQNLLEAIIPFTGKSMRIGISGIPGAGKSTFIETFGQFLIQQGKKVAVLAVDPSSSITKGSILGDKTRMESLSKEENAFIRPTPSKGYYGGIAINTYEAMLLCEAAGFDVILIETVGVGQSETMVANLIDLFILVAVAGAGDELQGIKRGIMEMADIIFINKVDEEPTQKDRYLYTDLKRALQLFSHTDWKTEVLMGSALENKNIDDVWNLSEKYFSSIQSSGIFEKKRKQQNLDRFNALLSQSVLDKYFSAIKKQENYPKLLKKIENGDTHISKIIADLMKEV